MVCFGTHITAHNGFLFVTLGKACFTEALNPSLLVDTITTGKKWRFMSSSALFGHVRTLQLPIPAGCWLLRARALLYPPMKVLPAPKKHHMLRTKSVESNWRCCIKTLQHVTTTSLKSSVFFYTCIDSHLTSYRRQLRKESFSR